MRLRQFAQRIRWIDLGIILVGVGLAIALRLSVSGFESRDYLIHVGQWYAALKAQGFSVVGTPTYNYAPLYLYFLYLTSVLLPNLPDVIAVKLTAMAFDFACAYFVYRLVRLKFSAGPLPLLAFFAALFLPTVVLNSSMWGQAESVYTAALLACVYCLATKRETAAFIAFGLAFAVKLHALFMAPLLVALWLRREVSLKSFLWIPVMYLLSIVPAWLAGRPIDQLLLIYLSQTDLYRQLTLNTPNWYAWLPNTKDPTNLFYPVGLIWTAALDLIYIVAIYRSRVKLNTAALIQLALLISVLMPFALPRMHERYYYPADILSIVYVFFFPSFYWVPVAVQLTSLLPYLTYFYGVEVVPLPLLALLPLIVIVFLARQSAGWLYGSRAEVRE